MYGNKKREVDDMTKIINNKWYTDEEYDREYHEVVLCGGYLTFLNVLKVEGEEDTYFLNDSIAKYIAGKTLGRDIIYVYSGGTIRREDMGIFVYTVADSKYEEVDVRSCKMSYHLVTREEITGITIYTRVEQIRSASIIAIRIRNIGERNNKRYYEIIKGDTCKYIAAKILDKSIYYLETGDTGKMDLKVNLVEYQELGKINITTKLIQDAIDKNEFNW